MGVILIIILLSLVILALVIMAIVTFNDNSWNSDNGGFIIFSVFFGLLLWLVIEQMTYRDGEPTSVEKDLISVMYDDNVVILRVGDEFQKTYDKKDEYDAVVCDKYELMLVIEYDITGEECNRHYELKID